MDSAMEVEARHGRTVRQGKTKRHSNMRLTPVTSISAGLSGYSFGRSRLTESTLNVLFSENKERTLECFFCMLSPKLPGPNSF
jgi:hypothetical protein